MSVSGHLLILLIPVLSLCGATEYYVRPTEPTNTSCPAQPCLTLSQPNMSSVAFMHISNIFIQLNIACSLSSPSSQVDLRIGILVHEANKVKVYSSIVHADLSFIVPTIVILSTQLQCTIIPIMILIMSKLVALVVMECHCSSRATLLSLTQ